MRLTWIRCAALASIVVRGTAAVNAQPAPRTVQTVPSPPSTILQKIELKSGSTLFAFILRSSRDELEVLDIQSNAEIRLKLTEVRSFSPENAEADAVKRLGIPVVLSWKVKQTASQRKKAGKIARLEGGLVYVTLGKTSGLATGDSLRVYRGDAEIRDPDTQEVLGRERKLVGELSVTDAQDSYSKARLSGEVDVDFKVGDQVEPKSQADAIVVLAFTTISGDVSPVGAALAEQLGTELAKRQIPVVERSQVARILDELAIQQTALFDQTKAQKLGRLAGAFAILTGTVDQRERRTLEVNCRLIAVDSGRVLLTESYRVFASATGRASAAPATLPGRSGSTNPRLFSPKPGNRRMPLARARENGTYTVEPIAHWALDGNGKNALSNSLNGSVIAGRATFGRGRVNQALVLDGRDQYFSVPHEDSLDVGQGDFSIALWVRFNPNDAAYPLASKGGYNWKRGWTLDVGANGKRGAVRLETSGGSERAPGSSQISTNQNVVKTGKWHHIAVVVKKSSRGGQTGIYVDGNVEATGKVDEVSLDNPDADFYIGRIDQYRLNGSVDDVWFFRGAISEAEIQSLMGRR
jgi:TolB-like protein